MRISGLIAITLFLIPTFAYAALININTADSALLDTLPGIGPSKAAAIIDYRNVHGLFARIEDIQNVNGIGSGVTYTNIAPLITVGDAVPAATSTPITASSTPSISSGGAASPYVPPPSAITVEITANTNAIVNAPFSLSGMVKIKGGSNDPSARVMWGFGDGSSTEGAIVEKTYRYPGTYLVTATAIDGPTTARDEMVITVASAQVRIADVSSSGITIANDSNERLDLSDWWISTDGVSFHIPRGTMLLSESSVMFPHAITHLLMTRNVALSYPDNTVAARYTPEVPIILQPSAATSSSPVVQTVEHPFGYDEASSDVTKTINTPVRETTAIAAPTATNQFAAVGAAVPNLAESPAGPTNSATPAILRSPWTLGFIGVALLSAGAFIFL